MAYAALNSLMHTIHSLADSSRQGLQSAYDHAMSLQCTLLRCSEGVTPTFDDRATEEARKLEDAIEFPLSTHFSFINLDHQLRQDVDCFVKTTKEIEEDIEGLWEEEVAKMIEEFVEELFLQRTAELTSEEEEEVSDMVGLCDQFLMIRDKLVVNERQHRVNIHEIIIWISGMAGIGKTALAKKIFRDIKTKFHRRAFVKVGHEFRLREVLQAIIAQFSPSNEELTSMEGDEDLYERFRRILKVTKSLIVLDDVWEDSFVLALIGKPVVLEDSGSRILVTSRIDGHHSYFCDLKMRFMNEEESWELLRRKVFGEEEECPPQLVKAGKKIAKNCDGLPLLIIAVAAQLLSKVQKNPECWKE